MLSQIHGPWMSFKWVAMTEGFSFVPIYLLCTLHPPQPHIYLIF